MKPYQQYNNEYNWRKKLSNWLGIEYSRLRKDELEGYKITIQNAPTPKESSSWKDYIYADDIVSGFDLLPQNKKINKRKIEKGVDYILDNQIYDRNAICDDLTPILRKVISQDIIDKIDFSSIEDLSLETIFGKLIDIYALDYLDYEDLIVVYNEISDIFIHRDQKEFRLKSKALSGLLESLNQLIQEHEQHKITLELPIIFNLREYLDLINNIRNLFLKEYNNLRGIVNDFKFFQDESRIRDKRFMLAYQGQREQGFL
jgi:hypothetical protein